MASHRKISQIINKYKLALKALKSIKYLINRIKILHADRWLKFKNSKLEKFIKIFNIKHSLSIKGCPYDNVVVETIYKTIKMEFILFIQKI